MRKQISRRLHFANYLCLYYYWKSLCLQQSSLQVYVFVQDMEYVLRVIEIACKTYNAFLICIDIIKGCAAVVFCFYMCYLIENQNVAHISP